MRGSNNITPLKPLSSVTVYIRRKINGQ